MSAGPGASSTGGTHVADVVSGPTAERTGSRDERTGSTAERTGSQEAIREFLATRRARLRPVDVGLADQGSTRRVPGLRREEVAELAGVSPGYYTRLERGRLDGASDSVLESLATALRLDDVEREYLFDLARGPVRGPVLRHSVTRLPEAIGHVVGRMDSPTIVVNASRDLVGANLLGRAVYAPVLEAGRGSFASFTFLADEAAEFYEDLEGVCATTAAVMRLDLARQPHNTDLRERVEDLLGRSERFRAAWARHDVHEHGTGTKVYRHPVVGRLELGYDVYTLASAPGLSMSVFRAEPGSVWDERLKELAGWARGTGLADIDLPIQ